MFLIVFVLLQIHQMMASVVGRKLVAHNIFILSITKFYSRIVLRKLSNEGRVEFRKVEKVVRNYRKIEADLTYLNNNNNKPLFQQKKRIVIYKIHKMRIKISTKNKSQIQK